MSARGYGGEVLDEAGAGEGTEPVTDDMLVEAGDERLQRLQLWTWSMSTAALIGVATGGVVIVLFLVLGAELLRPEGVVPEGIDVAADLARLLSEVWGAAGYWLLIVSVVIALWGTVVTNQDGWPRTFADAALILQHREGRPTEDGSWRRRLRNRTFLHRAHVVVTVTALPLVVFWLVRDPVAILSIGGIVTAVLTPVLVTLTLYLNHRRLPVGLRPGRAITGLMVAAGVFFTAFAVLYFSDLLGVPIL